MEEFQSEHFQDLMSLFEGAMAFVQQQGAVLFPTARELAAQNETFRAAFEKRFQDGVRAYLHPEETDRDRTLAAAVSLYLSDEDLPETARRALVRLLRDAGEYQEALLYAASFLEQNAWRTLFLGGFPLVDSDGCPRVDHLAMRGVDAKSTLAALLFYLPRYPDRKTRLFIAAACMDALAPERVPFCQAVCLWLTALRADEGQISDREVGVCFKRLSQCETNADWNAAASEFFRQYAASEFPPKFVSSAPALDLSAWRAREQEFDRIFAGRERHGWVVYDESSDERFLWCPGHMRIYRLHQDSVDLMDLKLSEDVFPQACFQMDESAQLSSFRVRRFQSRLPVLEWLNRLKWLKMFWNDAEAAHLLDVMERRVKSRSDARFTRKQLYRQFLTYTEKPNHNYETAKNLIANLERKITEGHLSDADEGYLTGFVEYYLKKDDFFSLDILLRKYYSRGLHSLYEKASLLLSERLKSQSGLRLAYDADLSGHVGERGSDKLKGLDVLSHVRCQRALDELSKEYAATDFTQTLAEEMEREADNTTYNFALKASCYFKAAALNCQPTEEDALERAKELTVKAFYWLAREQRRESNAEVERDYYLFCLHLKEDLPAQRIDANESLNGIVQDAEKRYFNPTDAYIEEDTPISALRLMAKNDGWDKAMTALLHLIFCVPSTLKEESRYWDFFTDEEIRLRFTQFLTAMAQGDFTGVSSEEEFRNALRDWRGKAVKMYNAFATELCDRALCPPEHPHLPQMEKRIRQIYGSFNQLLSSPPLMRLLQIRNEEDTQRLRQFQRILEDTMPLLTAYNYKLISKHTERCRNFFERMESIPPLYAFLFIRYPLSLIIRYMEMYAESLRGKLRPDIRAEGLFAEIISSGQLRVYLKILCDNDYSAINVYARAQTSEEKQTICKYVARDHNGYGFLNTPFPDVPEEGELLRIAIDLHFQAMETGEALSRSCTLTPTFHSRQRHVEYAQVYNSTRALDGTKREDQCTFTGRDDIINRICSKFRGDPSSVILLYGQKRVGKSSISNYVLNKLRQERTLLVAEPQNVQLNLKNRDENRSVQDQTEAAVREFYRMALYGIEKAFGEKENQDRIDCMRKEIKIIRATEKALENEALDAHACRRFFDEGVQAVCKGFEREEKWRGTHILLCYDEFQNYYANILRHTLQPDFLGFIKAFKESKPPISLLLVGSELMIPFIEYGSGNAFSVIHEEKVLYLEEKAAKALISNSIRQMMGNSVPNPFQYVEEEIFHLSAGNPLYIHLLCENLTEMLNDEKRVFASMDMIFKLLKSEVIGAKYFDNLNNPESLDKPDEDGIKFASPQDNKWVLQQIAVRRGMRTEGKNVGTSLPELERDLEGKTKAEVRRIVEELFKRKVVLKNADENYRIAVPLYEAWIWEKQMDVGYFPVIESTSA